MKTYRIWLKTEYKRAMISLPFMLIEAIVLMAVIGTIAFCCTKLLYGREQIKPFTAAVVLSEENVLTDMALAFVEHMESVSAVCGFVTTDLESGMHMLETQEAQVLIVLPKQVIEDILSGINTPVTVYTKENTEGLPLVFRQLTDVGVAVLSVAQAEIYGMYDLAETQGVSQGLREMQNDINKWNLNLVLQRENVFRKYTLSATEHLTTESYYTGAAWMFYLMASGAACHMYLTEHGKRRNRQMELRGIRTGMRIAGKIGVQSCLLGAGMVIPLGILLFLQTQGIITMYWSLSKAVGLLLGIVCFSAFAVMLYQLTGRGNGGMVLISMCSICLQIIGGGLIPFALLPEQIQNLTPYVPSSYVLTLIWNLFRRSGETSYKDMGTVVLFILLFYGITYLCAKMEWQEIWTRMMKNRRENRRKA